MIYNLIGRIVVRTFVLRMKAMVSPRTATFGGVGILAGVAALVVVGYLASRDVPEA
ncbi:MAG: hypothetical protein JJE10_05145 [Thermoleophilia bacterium]|nr:hypothetical protein [Thermoleophilia bacterium]